MGNKVHARTMERVSVYRRFVYFCLPLCYCCARYVCAPGDEALNKNPSLKNFNRARGFVFKLSSVLRLLDATLR